jgi:4-oxalocrotonate tautomerase
MPYVNVKVVKQQVDQEKKNALVSGLMNIIENTMGRDPKLTVIIVDEIDQANWYIGRYPIDASKQEIFCSVKIHISKGTSSPEQMAEVIKAGKELVKKTLGSNDMTNYFIINELNPDSWGFDGISMTIRNRMEQSK